MLAVDVTLNGNVLEIDITEADEIVTVDTDGTDIEVFAANGVETGDLLVDASFVDRIEVTSSDSEDNQTVEFTGTDAFVLADGLLVSSDIENTDFQIGAGVTGVDNNSIDVNSTDSVIVDELLETNGADIDLDDGGAAITLGFDMSTSGGNIDLDGASTVSVLFDSFLDSGGGSIFLGGTTIDGDSLLDLDGGAGGFIDLSGAEITSTGDIIAFVDTASSGTTSIDASGAVFDGPFFVELATFGGGVNIAGAEFFGVDVLVGTNGGDVDASGGQFITSSFDFQTGGGDALLDDSVTDQANLASVQTNGGDISLLDASIDDVFDVVLDSRFTNGFLGGDIDLTGAQLGAVFPIGLTQIRSGFGGILLEDTNIFTDGDDVVLLGEVTVLDDSLIDTEDGEDNDSGTVDLSSTTIDAGDQDSGRRLFIDPTTDGAFFVGDVLLPSGFTETGAFSQFGFTFQEFDSNGPNGGPVYVRVDGNAISRFDFGDAPDSYGTLLASDGARHDVLGGDLRFGVERDPEDDGLPTADALGDDLDFVADEDGIEFVTDLIAGEIARVQVTTNQDGMIDAFIDFNNDGDFDEANEKIFDSRFLEAGTRELQFTVPAGAEQNVDTYARFRISTQGGLAATGPADDGEVEDYTVSLGEPVVTPAAPIIIDNSDGAPEYTEAGDNVELTKGGQVANQDWRDGALSGAFQGDYRFSYAGTGADTATYTFDIVEDATYSVGVTWVEGGNRATDAPYEIFVNNVSVANFEFDQTQDPSSFALSSGSFATAENGGTALEFVLTAGDTLEVVLSDDISGDDDTVVIADAVRIFDVTS